MRLLDPRDRSPPAKPVRLRQLADPDRATPELIVYSLLQTINDPTELRQLDRSQLHCLAEELRAFFARIGFQDPAGTSVPTWARSS